MARSRRLRSEPGSVLTGGQRSGGGDVDRGCWAGWPLLILVAGAANVGGVLVARAAASTRQTAIHLSLGAGRLAIARRLLVEGLGLGRDRWSHGAARRTRGLASSWPRWRCCRPCRCAWTCRSMARSSGSWPWLSGACGLGLAAGPAVWTARVNAREALGASTRAAGGVAVSRLRRVLVSAQVGVTLALVAGAVLLTRSLDHADPCGSRLLPAGSGRARLRSGPGGRRRGDGSARRRGAATSDHAARRRRGRDGQPRPYRRLDAARRGAPRVGRARGRRCDESWRDRHLLRHGGHPGRRRSRLHR